MSISDWSDMEIDFHEIEEDASVRVVKSSTVSHLCKGLQNPTPEQKQTPDPDFENSDQILRLSTSYSPQLTSKDACSPVKFKINTKIVGIFDEIKCVPPRIDDINERCYKFKEKVKAKIEKMTKDQEELQKKVCPFKPQVLDNGKQIRRFEEFLQEVKKCDRNKDKKTTDLRTKGKEGTRPPLICKNSEKIVKKKNQPQPVHQKLYKQGRVLKKNPEKKIEILSFSPTVNPKSHDLKREMSVDQLLYQDAMRRNTKRSQSPTYIKEKFISSRSEQVLTEKFIKEYNKALDYLYPKDKTEFTYAEFVTILCELSFIHNDIDDKFYQFEKELVSKAWERVLSIGKYPRICILTFLLSVMNYEHASADSDVKNLHREFISFYECRHWFVINEKKRREQRELTFTPSQFSGYSFSPCEISRKSVGKGMENSLVFNDRLREKWKWGRFSLINTSPKTILGKMYDESTFEYTDKPYPN